MTASVETRELTDLPPDPTLGGTGGGDTDPWACEICGQPVPPTPSGRKPRLMRCDEHRKGTGSSTGGTRTRNGITIRDGMLGLHGMLAMGVGFVSIPTGDNVWLADKAAIEASAENIADAWVKACDVNPKLKKQVVKFLEAAGTLSLAGAYMPLAFAVTMNHRTAAQAKHQAPTNGADTPRPFGVPLPFATDTPT